MQPFSPSPSKRGSGGGFLTLVCVPCETIVCHSERSEESLNYPRFFTPLRFVQNDDVAVRMIVWCHFAEDERAASPGASTIFFSATASTFSRE